MEQHKLEFSHDWISGYHALWEKLIPVRPGLRILEIGSYEGRSTVWFLQRFPDCRVICIDTFEGGQDHKELGVDFSGTQARFLHNISPWIQQVTLYSQHSRDALRGLELFQDIVLVDGSHLAPDVLSDIVLSWPLLVPGGHLILDDYGWGKERPLHERPTPAIDAFFACHAGQFQVLEAGYQVIVCKL